MRYKIPSANWHMALAAHIERAAAGDVLMVNNWHAAQLGHVAARRMRGDDHGILCHALETVAGDCEAGALDDVRAARLTPDRRVAGGARRADGCGVSAPTIACLQCGGSGWDTSDALVVVCPKCEGDGKIPARCDCGEIATMTRRAPNGAKVYACDDHADALAC